MDDALTFPQIIDALSAPIATTTADGRIELVNRQLLEYLGLSVEELESWQTTGVVHPDDLPRVVTAWRASLERGEAYELELRVRRSNGAYQWVQVRGLPVRDGQDRMVRWCVLLTDIAERKRAEALLAGERRLLEMVASGCPLEDVLETMCRLVDAVIGKSACSILLIDRAGRFRHGSGPTLPAGYETAVNGAPVVCDAGPCGTAASLKAQVIVSDLVSDPRWIGLGWRTLVLDHGLKSVCSTPIVSSTGTVLGTFAIYQHEPVPPSPLLTDLIARFTHVASIAIERESSDERLQESERNLQLTIDTIPALVWSANADGTAEFFNRHYLDFIGLSAEQASGWGWTAVVHPDDLRELSATWQRILASRAAGEAEARLRRRDGSYRWFLFRANPLRDEHGTIVKWYGINTDIEGRKQAEAELRRAYDSFTDAQRLSHTGSFITDLLGDDHNWSEEAFRIFDFEPGTKVSVQRIRDIIHPDDLPSFESVIARGMQGENVAFAFRILTVGGAVKHVRGVAHVVEHVAGRPLFVGALQDVTDSKVAEEALDRARSELAHVARVTAASAFTASVAHEVNQPLSGIITNAGTCLRMLAGNPPDVEGARETAKRTLRDGNRAADVITRLRALFSKREFTLEPLDINEVAREVVALSLPELQRNRMVFRSEFAADLPPITGDRIQLQQVILNLLRNASDAMLRVDDRPRHLVIGTEQEAGDRVRLTVRDVGAGLDAQSMNKLFDAFYTTKTDGMGIGLSVSRSIIERHHGRLWAEPNEGPGTTFAFAIPAAPQAVADSIATRS